MKVIFTKMTITLLCAIVVSAIFTQVSAQEKDSVAPFKSYFYLQPNVGLTQYFGDLNPDDYYNTEVKLAGSVIAGWQFSRILGFRGQFMLGKLASDSEAKKLTMEDKIWDLSGQLTLNVNEIFNHNPNRFLNIYLFGGAGYLHGNNTVTNYDGSLFKEEVNSGLTYPLGGGAALRLSNSISLNLEYGHRITPEDLKLDFHSSVSKYDQYSYASAGLTFKLQKKDKDRDGIADKKDLCPEEPGKVEFEGCPDKDSDGIPDKDDVCPDVAGKPEFKGCPDTDGDGIPDQEDACPTVAGKKETKGCPDTDGDGVIDGEDLWPTVFGLAIFAGVPDTDGDGIPDNNDPCKEVKGPAQFMGCPDTDGDGIPDNKDNCPEVAGVAANNGCPALIMGDVLQKTVYFDTDSWIALAKYIIDMNEIAAYMNENPEAVISISGHADSRESENYNLRLSERRADYVIKYLKKKGMKSVNIDKTFFGESRPVADNNTSEGRALNRRVEIKITK